MVLGLCALGAAFGATAKDAPPATAITGEQADAILLELREIKGLLQKIEKQGGARPPARPRPSKTATIELRGDRPSLGSEDAPVTVIEFTDYQCPFCKRFNQATFTSLKRDYMDTGKVRWLVFDLPLGFHANARQAAQAARCAGEQGKFWEMRDTLFLNSAHLEPAKLKRYGQIVGLDQQAFEACLSSDRYLEQIDQDAQVASEARITGTPTFVIGPTAADAITGRTVVGAQALNVFKGVIDRMAVKPTPAQPDGERAPVADG